MRTSQNNLLIAAAILSVVAFSLGCWGYGFGDWSQTSDAVYKSLQFFALNHTPDTSNNSPPWQVHTARLLAAAVFFLTVFVAVASLTHQELNARLARHVWADHDVVVGLGRRGLPLVKQLTERESFDKNWSWFCRCKAWLTGCSGTYHRVIVIERDAQHPALETAQRTGAVVLIGDATDPSVLALAGIRKARRIYALGGSDEVNAAITLAVSDTIKNRPAHRPPLQVCPEIVASSTRSVLRRHVASIREKQYQLELHTSDANELTARRFFAEHRLDRKASQNAGSAKYVQLVIIGFGGLGKALFLQAAHIAQFRSGERLRVTLIDPHATKLFKRFKAEFPNFDNNAMAPIVDVDLVDDDAAGRLAVTRLHSLIQTDKSATTVVMTINPVAEALRVAYRLVPICKSGDAALHLRTACVSELSKVIGTALEITPLSVDHAIDPECIVDEQQDELARGIHEHYLENYGPQTDPATGIKPEPETNQYEWPELSEHYRASNRSAADFIPILWQQFGYELIDEKDLGDRILVQQPVDDDETISMAKLEHQRWYAERYLAGWTFATTRNNPLKQHPDLKPWADLSETTKKKDIDNILLHPSLLADKIGKAIVREMVKDEEDA